MKLRNYKPSHDLALKLPLENSTKKHIKEENVPNQLKKNASFTKTEIGQIVTFGFLFMPVSVLLKVEICVDMLVFIFCNNLDFFSGNLSKINHSNTLIFYEKK